MNRRDFLRLLGWISGSTAMSSCGTRKLPERLVSYILPPEEGVVPGEARVLPSTCTECPAGCGMLAKIRDGRPIKLEGIPGHPVSDGGLCVRGQSSLFRLYHPERLRRPTVRDQGKRRPIGWDQAFSLIAESLEASRRESRGSLFLSGRTTGSLSRLIDAFCGRLGIRRLPGFEPYAHSAVAEANRLLFGERDVPHYRIDEADFLLTVGADVLETHVTPVAYTRMISRAAAREDFLWYHVEPHISLTGANAHRRFAVAAGKERPLLAFLLREVLTRRPPKSPPARGALAGLPPLTAEAASAATGIPAASLREIADRLVDAKRPLPIAGGVSTAGEDGVGVAAACALIQWATGAIPDRVDFSASENYRSVGTFRDMEALSARMGRGEAGVVFLLRTNPVFSLPKEFRFGENLKKAKLSVGMGDLPDETLAEADLVLPLSHSLEAWGDAEPRKGIVSLLQPMLRSPYEARADGDALIGILRKASGADAPASYREFLEGAWGKRLGEAARSRLLATGYVVDAQRRKTISLDGRRVASAVGATESEGAAESPVLVLAPSLRTFDGRSRPLALLSKIPDPLSTVSYGPWISVSPETAKKAGLEDRDEVSVSSSGWSVVLPVKVQPLLPEGVLLVHRDALASPPVRIERRSGGPVDYIGGVRIAKTGREVALPILSGSLSQMGRGLIPGKNAAKERRGHERITLYPEHAHTDYRWGMAIDLSLCNGCSACVAACHIENNVPVAGKRDHLDGREMSWLRIEPFYENGGVDFLPMLCQHCDDAPCESVCPVFAAYHNPEGLNVQVYARCVGTRYCSNNCPYKVRRFNWWQHRWEKPLDHMLNPDVPVRSVGVMEKCTFCVQRIRTAKDKAKDESRKVRDGEFTTACAQSCPAGAIVFGNLKDEGSRVSRLARSGRAYRVFEDLGTESAIHYLGGRKPGEGA